MAAPSETFIDPADSAANGSDHGGAAFVDGAFANATNTLTKIGSFAAATCQVGDKIYLDDNGSGEVTAALYTISVRTDDDNVVLTADIRSGANDPTDVRCDQHDGTSGTPWATVQHALDFTTRDAANGDRFNVKAGTDDVLAAALDFTTYGAPTEAAPWICQGYTTAAGDGGIGGISGNGGNFKIFSSSALDYIFLIDLHLHNTGTAIVVHLDNYINLINVEVDNSTSHGVFVDSICAIVNCYVHNIGAYGIKVTTGLIYHCVFESGANNFSTAIYADQKASIINNLINISSSGVASDGIAINRPSSAVINNTIYSNAGTGQGIVATGKGQTIINNIVEGFSGVLGIGYDVNNDLVWYGHNSAYNNATNFDLLAGTGQYRNLGNNTELGASPFTDAANGDFSVDTTVKAGSWPTTFKSITTDQYLDEGAAQREEPAGSAGSGKTTGGVPHVW